MSDDQHPTTGNVAAVTQHHCQPESGGYQTVALSPSEQRLLIDASAYALDHLRCMLRASPMSMSPRERAAEEIRLMRLLWRCVAPELKPAVMSLCRQHNITLS